MTEKNDIEAIRDFMKEVKRTFAGGIATEHTYRPVLKILLDRLGAGEVYAVNEPKRIACGAPDLALMHKDIAIGYLEAKDIGVPIRGFKGANKNQFDRYKNDLDNLIYTDCLKWDFYLNGDLVRSVSIAEIRGGEIKPKSDNFDALVDYLQDFLDQRPQTIKTAEVLTKYMAKRTHMIRYSFGIGMKSDSPLQALIKQHNLFDKMLIKGITRQEFADIYAQTITYGILIAKLRNKADTNFIRQNIPDLLPTSYPFLRKLFLFIASDDLNNNLDQPIDDLINLYRVADVDGIMKIYRQGTGREDPFLHFYEDFLTAYNPEERKRSGVYYTPEPVVNFIVRGVDWVLKNKFDLPEGLANSEKTNVPWKTDRVGEDEIRNVHKVQILDPATGTGTFLAQTIRQIAEQIKKSVPSHWSSYVDSDLLPRLHGFESMMAPYAMSYLKMDMVLDDLDYTPTDAQPDRMSIYLTNSLTEATKDIPDLAFIDWLTDEARGAADIKDNFPIMCVIGNPPYLGESKNKDPWINKLIKDYKKEPDSSKPLQERNPKWINDDYVKFIRLAQHMVDKNGEGVVGMITSHGYLDNPTFRGMRWHLMNSFDGIYILDLHGNSRKKEVSPNGDPDKNVFDIMAGVSIIIAWKTKRAEDTKKPLAKVFHGDVWGTRKEKFKALSTKNLDSKLFQKIKPCAPDYFFTPKDYDLLEEYGKGFKIMELMKTYGVGMTTAHDNFCMGSKEDLINRFEKFKNADANENLLHEEFNVKKKQGWSILKAHSSLSKIDDIAKLIQPVMYRTFDNSHILYHDNVVWRTVRKIMRHFLKKGNLGLIVGRQGQVVGSMPWNVVFIQDQISDINIFYRGGGTVFPLYIYPDAAKNLDTNGHSRRVNMDENIRKAIEDSATDSKFGKPEEKEIFDYIYGILHTPAYRTRYAEFLKNDYPYIPYPKTPAEFWHLSSVGTKLRKMHLKPDSLDGSAYTFDGKDTGKSIVERPKFDDGKVWINETQYFDNVPESVWDFYIGGYQPARKWLKDRKDQTLEHKDILHYQRIIAVLVQTEQTMQTIKWNRP